MRRNHPAGYHPHSYECAECQKRTFPTKKEAKLAARRIDKTMKPYAGCLGGWHIGHQRLGSRDAYRK